MKGVEDWAEAIEVFECSDTSERILASLGSIYALVIETNESDIINKAIDQFIEVANKKREILEDEWNNQIAARYGIVLQKMLDLRMNPSPRSTGGVSKSKLSTITTSTTYITSNMPSNSTKSQSPISKGPKFRKVVSPYKSVSSTATAALKGKGLSERIMSSPYRRSTVYPPFQLSKHPDKQSITKTIHRASESVGQKRPSTGNVVYPRPNSMFKPTALIDKKEQITGVAKKAPAKSPINWKEQEEKRKQMLMRERKQQQKQMFRICRTTPMSDDFQTNYLSTRAITKVMAKVLPKDSYVSDEAKDLIQECATEFILYMASEARDCADYVNRKDVSGVDLINATKNLGYQHFAKLLDIYNSKIKQMYIKKQQEQRKFIAENNVGTTKNIPSNSQASYKYLHGINASQGGELKDTISEVKNKSSKKPWNENYFRQNYGHFSKLPIKANDITMKTISHNPEKEKQINPHNISASISRNDQKLAKTPSVNTQQKNSTQKVIQSSTIVQNSNQKPMEAPVVIRDSMGTGNQDNGTISTIEHPQLPNKTLETKSENLKPKTEIIENP